MSALADALVDCHGDLELALAEDLARLVELGLIRLDESDGELRAALADNPAADRDVHP